MSETRPRINKNTWNEVQQHIDSKLDRKTQYEFYQRMVDAVAELPATERRVPGGVPIILLKSVRTLNKNFVLFPFLFFCPTIVSVSEVNIKYIPTTDFCSTIPID